MTTTEEAARQVSEPRLVAGDGQYEVMVGDDHVGSVHRARVSADRYRHESPSLSGRGAWRWFASPGVNDEVFTTRKEAVAELLRRRNRTKVECVPACFDHDCQAEVHCFRGMTTESD